MLEKLLFVILMEFFINLWLVVIVFISELILVIKSLFLLVISIGLLMMFLLFSDLL